MLRFFRDEDDVFPCRMPERRLHVSARHERVVGGERPFIFAVGIEQVEPVIPIGPWLHIDQFVDLKIPADGVAGREKGSDPGVDIHRRGMRCSGDCRGMECDHQGSEDPHSCSPRALVHHGYSPVVGAGADMTQRKPVWERLVSGLVPRRALTR